LRVGESVRDDGGFKGEKHAFQFFCPILPGRSLPGSILERDVQNASYCHFSIR
jgi:hypothetical protein